MTSIASQCVFCQHFRPEVRDRNVCTAFPDGIPDAVMLTELDHRRPLPGDQGVQFLAAPGFTHPLGDHSETHPAAPLRTDPPGT